jgi:hypothetical protein
LYRERLFGAYVDDEMVGFIMLADAGRYAMLGQIVSKIEHRDKSPNNALISKAVQVCAESGYDHLVYANWPEGPLADFKRQNGFEKVTLPRYYIPLTTVGRMTLATSLHKGVRQLVPKEIRNKLKPLRHQWHRWRKGR